MKKKDSLILKKKKELIVIKKNLKIVVLKKTDLFFLSKRVIFLNLALSLNIFNKPHLKKQFLRAFRKARRERIFGIK